MRVVQPSEFTWNDVGSWAALASPGAAATDDHGNGTRGDVIALDCARSVIRAEDGHTIVAMGLVRMAVIHAGDVTFVAPLGSSEKIPEVHRILRERGREELL